MTDIRVSIVQSATGTETRDFDVNEIIKITRTGGKNIRAQIERIRKTWRSELDAHGDFRRAKKAIDPAKKRLPGAMWSGTFTDRAKPVDEKKLIAYSGLLCVDLDHLGEQRRDAFAKLSRSPHARAIFASPSGDGLKVVFRVPADASKHMASYRAAEKHVKELTGVQIDRSCKDLARLCFLSYDPEVFHNPNAVEIEPLAEPEKSRSSANGASVDLSARQQIVSDILGQVDWESETSGFTTCPGKHLHTTGDGDRDCKIFLNEIPTVSCFHNSCRGILDDVNHKLRSRVGKAEFTGRDQASEQDGKGQQSGEQRGNGHAPDAFNALLLKGTDIKPKKLKWLWHSRIPLGKVTVLDGDPGLAKSLMSIDIATCVTTGRAMPNSATADLPEAAGVVFLSAEDDPEDTIQPRLVLAGADLNRVVLLTGIRREDGISLPTIADLDAIRQAIQAVGGKLVVIDPLMAYLPAETNSYRDQDIRRSLAPLAALAAELAVAVLVIRHLNKSFNNNPLYRGGGSIGIIGAARSGLLVVKDPDDDSRCILSVSKSNLAKLPASLAYEVLSNAEEIPFINWLGPTQHTAASLLHDQAEGEEERSEVQAAEDFLTAYLRLMPRKAKDVLGASKAAFIAEKTLRRAKTRLKVWSERNEFKGEYFWGLPSQSNDSSWMANSPMDGQSEGS